MIEMLGADNGVAEYIFVLLIYAGLYITMRQMQPRIEPEFRRSFLVLYVIWVPGVFIANYLLFLAGVMSFLPWANNFIHTFIWIGLCLLFLYSFAYKRPLWEQFVMFAVYSFVIKVTENYVLGTWELGHFFSIAGNFAYITGWSLVDGLFPFGCALTLRIASRFIDGIVTS
jgi:hypothetical protein